MDQNYDIQECFNFCLCVKLANIVNNLEPVNNKYAIRFYQNQMHQQQQEKYTNQFDNKSKINNQIQNKNNLNYEDYERISKIAYEKLLKSKKKQSTIKKKKRKFQKLNKTVQAIQQDQISQSQNHTPQKYIQHSHSKSPQNQYLNAKSLLLQTQSPHKFKNSKYLNNSQSNFTNSSNNSQKYPNKSAVNSMKTDQNYKSLSPSPINNKEYTQTVSPFNYKSSYQISMNDSSINYSPGQQLNQSKQINVVKHSNNIKPSISNMVKKKDIIQIMETVKQEKKIKTGKNSSLLISTSKVQNKNQSKVHLSPTSKTNVNQGHKQISQSKLDKLYIKSVGNKYIQLVIENYRDNKK